MTISKRMQRKNMEQRSDLYLVLQEEGINILRRKQGTSEATGFLCWSGIFQELVLIVSRTQKRDFPSGLVVKNSPSNAGVLGSIPGGGTKIPRVAGQISPRTATTEPVCSRARVPQLERSHAPERRSCMLQLRPKAAK